MSEQQIKTQLGITRKQLNQMVAEGKIVKHPDGSYEVVQR